MLPVDLDAIVSTEICWDMLQRHNRLRLVEQWPALDAHIVECNGERYVGHFVIPFTARVKNDLVKHVGKTRGHRSAIRRRFTPLSEWSYAKLYGGEVVTERFLLQIIAPLLREAIRGGSIDRWFFVRYADPRPHIRLRIHGPEQGPSGIVRTLEQHLADAVERRVLAAVQYDTYVREVERYGGQGAIELAERAFHIDSETIVGVLGAVDADTRSSRALEIALWSVDALAAAFFPEQATRRALYETLSADQNSALRKRESETFRALKRNIDFILNGSGPPSDIAVIQSQFQQRSSRLTPLVTQWKHASDRPLEDIVQAVLHMNVNRLGVTADEPLLYGLLRRVLNSQAARARATVIP